MDLPEALNAQFIDTQYQRWKTDPQTLSKDWQYFFKGFEIATAGVYDGEAGADKSNLMKQARVEALKYRYRDLGHLLACMDPLEDACPMNHPLLELESFDLAEADLDTVFVASQVSENGHAKLRDIIQSLKDTYCRSIGVEYMHLQDPGERVWLQQQMENTRNRPEADPDTRRRIAFKLHQASLLEQFLNKKFMAVTRFSLEGGEAVIPLLDTVADYSAAAGCRELILGMAHRGRLNVQAHLLGKPYADVFGEFENCYDPENLVGAGDVKYHNGFLADIQTAGGTDLRVLLVNNPSHLEAVGPVVQGVARGRQAVLGAASGAQSTSGPNGNNEVLPVLIHGDSAFAGQGVVAETLNLSQLRGYQTGGTVHLVINNQIGYTTLPQDARSTRYSTDIAKMLMVPIFHVHGEDPEAVVHAARLATEYRLRYRKDVVIDLICFRRYGHNEGDEPYYTQPEMYSRIRKRPALNRVYSERLIQAGVLDAEEDRALRGSITDALEREFEEVHGSSCAFPEIPFYGVWDSYSGSYRHEPVQTGVPAETLQDLSAKLNHIPDGFEANRKLKKLLARRQEAVATGSGIDWANAESLAFASLLAEGTPVRLSGQDSGRGTFSQRHSVWYDSRNATPHTPLNHLNAQQAVYEVFNSPLSEYAVMAFEYGYALVRPEALVMWEAQFGDFANTAQAVIDLFIASGETKWQRLNGLVLLLPHGAEGVGPEHTSARPERFLQLCAGNNMLVAYPTAAAQYFHLLRQQARSAVRKPLIVMTPKSLLRHPRAVSALQDLAEGHFRTVIDDSGEYQAAERLLMCSGKIYYELLERREKLDRRDVAVVRLEQFYPFPEKAMADAVSRYGRAREWFWVQEEPRNMGAWTFIQPRLERLRGETTVARVGYIGREPAASPASGFPFVHKAGQEKILSAAIPS